MVFNIDLCEAYWLNLLHIVVEGHNFCVIWWAAREAKVPWYVVDILEEVTDLARRLGISNYHIKRSAKSLPSAYIDVDRLVKEGILWPNLILSLIGLWLWFGCDCCAVFFFLASFLLAQYISLILYSFWYQHTHYFKKKRSLFFLFNLWNPNIHKMKKNIYDAWGGEWAIRLVLEHLVQTFC